MSETLELTSFEVNDVEEKNYLVLLVEQRERDVT